MLSGAIAEYLEGESLGTVYVEQLPETDELCAAVYTRGGAPPESRVGLETAAIQVIVRGPGADPRTGHARALAIYNELHNYAPGGPIGAVNREHVLLITANQSGPVHIGRDANGRHEWSLNFTVRTHNPDRRE